MLLLFFFSLLEARYLPSYFSEHNLILYSVACEFGKDLPFLASIGCILQQLQKNNYFVGVKMANKFPLDHLIVNSVDAAAHYWQD